MMAPVEYGRGYEMRYYVIHRSELVEPGRPYVLAECAEELLAGLAADVAPDLETVSETSMREDPELASAMSAWQAQDDSLCDRERAGAELLAGG
jgi:hypothetical protein